MTSVEQAAARFVKENGTEKAREMLEQLEDKRTGSAVVRQARLSALRKARGDSDPPDEDPSFAQRTIRRRS